MSAPDRRAMIERPGAALSVRRQCALLNLARSGVYRPKPVTTADDLTLMRRIDELHLELPFYGSRRMMFELNKEGRGVNRKRVQRLMRVMGIEALVPRPGTSKAAPGHKIYPYLLRGVAITEPNHVWAADITYIPMARGFLYLVAIMDWASRAVLAWRLSNTIDAGFCVEALEEALLRHGKPKISARCESIVATTPTRARNSPAPRSPGHSKLRESRFPWTGAAASWTTSSSNGSGARSNMKRSI
jgi:putative transposase